QVAEEVVSQTFAVAWRRRGMIPADPLPWLLGVSRNVLRESQRDSRRRAWMEAELRAWISRPEQVEPDVAESGAEREGVRRARPPHLDPDGDPTTRARILHAAMAGPGGGRIGRARLGPHFGRPALRLGAAVAGVLAIATAVMVLVPGPLGRPRTETVPVNPAG